MVVNTSIYRTIGHILHALNLGNILLYGGSLYLYGNEDDAGIFDPAWLKEGFCLPDETTAFWTTHDLSGYVMVLMALFGLAVRYQLSSDTITYNNKTKNSTSTIKVSKQADELTYWALLGALGHASGHFILSNAKRHKFLPPGKVTFLDDLKQSSSFLVALGKAGPGYPLFWIPLVKTYMRNTAENRVAAIAFLFYLGSLFVPSAFGFSYAQAVLFGGMSLDQIFFVPQEQQQTLEYALWPLLTTLPNGAWAWFECMKCSTHPWMIQYGHILYDTYMVSSYTIFYMLFWCIESRKQQTAKKVI